MKYFHYLVAIALLLPCTRGWTQTAASYVNPFIGTTNYGATHPGAQYPHSMASIAPFNVAFGENEGNVHEKDSEWNSRVYIHENKYLTGYSHLNLSGVGCPEFGSILTMPIAGPLDLNPATNGSTYTDEQARPGFYAHKLNKYNIDVELSSTKRAGISRYVFPEGAGHILLNLGLGLTNETGGMVRVISNQEVEGFKTVGTFCYNPDDVRPVYFVAKLSRQAKKFGAWKKMPPYRAVEKDWVKYNDDYKPYPSYTREMAGDNIGAYFSFDTQANDTVLVKVGISFVSIANARENLEKEIPGYDFQQVADGSYAKWEQLLGRVKVEGNEKDKIKFYTALYHTLIHPNIIQDVNGDYPMMGQLSTGNSKERNRYSVFSLWDTYRNVHPLLSLLYPEIQSEMVNSMVDIYKESGWLPKWELAGMETNVMVGDPAAPVVADSYLRGIRDFDVATAYEGMKKGTDTRENNLLRPENASYLKLGYVPVEEEDQWGGSVSTALEYYISDWNISQLAEALDLKDDAKTYRNRSMGYKQLFDEETGMLRPKKASGSFYGPFDPESGKNFEPTAGYVEGCAWNYRFYVPHDMKGLIKLNGGPRAFVKELSATFEQGHFDMANEPDITYPFLFNYVAGEEWRTQQRVSELLKKHYDTTPGGIPGNDDTGALSTWLLYAMMGFYPVCPGDMDYALTSPVFDRIEIALNPKYYSGDKIVITSTKESPESIFIRKLNRNNRQHKSFFINHQDLVKGGTLTFQLSDRPTQ